MKKRKKLNFEERSVIETMLKQGYSQRAIAKKLGRVPSTINKEIRLNSGHTGYVATYASVTARDRQTLYRHRPRKMTIVLKNKIRSLLKKDWSPEQISGVFKNQGIRISHEIIYQWIWRNKREGGKLYQHLKRKGRRYRKRGAAYMCRGHIKNRIDIDLRPQVVDDRSRIGDWEIDSIVGKHHKGVIVSMVERKTRYTKLVKLERSQASRVAIALVRKLTKFARMHLVHSITSDNGKEFAYHEHVCHALDTAFYFAKPYSAWQRGTNENTNGLVRYYLPKGTDFSTVTHQQIQHIEDKLNNRPRKCLGYRTPKELMGVAMAS